MSVPSFLFSLVFTISSFFGSSFWEISSAVSSNPSVESFHIIIFQIFKRSSCPLNISSLQQAFPQREIPRLQSSGSQAEERGGDSPVNLPTFI